MGPLLWKYLRGSRSCLRMSAPTRVSFKYSSLPVYVRPMPCPRQFVETKITWRIFRSNKNVIFCYQGFKKALVCRICKRQWFQHFALSNIRAYALLFQVLQTQAPSKHMITVLQSSTTKTDCPPLKDARFSSAWALKATSPVWASEAKALLTWSKNYLEACEDHN